MHDLCRTKALPTPLYSVPVLQETLAWFELALLSILNAYYQPWPIFLSFLAFSKKITYLRVNPWDKMNPDDGTGTWTNDPSILSLFQKQLYQDPFLISIFQHKITQSSFLSTLIGWNFLSSQSDCLKLALSSRSPLNNQVFENFLKMGQSGLFFIYFCPFLIAISIVVTFQQYKLKNV